MAERLKGNTATFWFNAFAGLKIKLTEGEESVLVQYFRLENESTVYEEPVECELQYLVSDDDVSLYEDGPNEDGPKLGFIWQGVKFTLDEFMRDDYMETVGGSK